MAQQTLKKCPHCGGKALALWSCGCVNTGIPCGDLGGKYLERVYCSTCNSTAPSIKTWNRRKE